MSAAVVGFVEARESGGVTCVFESIVSDSILLVIRGTDAKKLVIDNQRESIHFPQIYIILGFPKIYLSKTQHVNFVGQRTLYFLTR